MKRNSSTHIQKPFQRTLEDPSPQKSKGSENFDLAIPLPKSDYTAPFDSGLNAAENADRRRVDKKCLLGGIRGRWYISAFILGQTAAEWELIF